MWGDEETVRELRSIWSSLGKWMWALFGTLLIDLLGGSTENPPLRTDWGKGKVLTHSQRLSFSHSSLLFHLEDPYFILRGKVKGSLAWAITSFPKTHLWYSSMQSAFATQMIRIGTVVFYVFLMCDSIPEIRSMKGLQTGAGKGGGSQYCPQRW